MKNIIILGALAAAAAAFFFIGPNVLMGGPSKSEIERISREIAREAAPSAELAKLAEDATITPKGICNKEGEVFTCVVDLKIEGNEPQSLVTQFQKGENGEWAAVR